MSLGRPKELATPSRGRMTPVDEITIEELSEDECLALLGAHSVGRLAVVRDKQPLIFPVNYVLEGRTVAFRTDPGTKLTWATLGRVAFEIDSTDPLRLEGWSVLVQGIGTEITEALDSVRAHLGTLARTLGGGSEGALGCYYLASHYWTTHRPPAWVTVAARTYSPTMKSRSHPAADHLD